MVFPLIIAINVLVSWVFYQNFGSEVLRLNQGAFKTRFWEIQSIFSVVDIVRILIAWGCYSFASGLLVIILPDEETDLPEVASPSYSPTWRNQDKK
jgi:hypothetical protein